MVIGSLCYKCVYSRWVQFRNLLKNIFTIRCTNTVCQQPDLSFLATDEGHAHKGIMCFSKEIRFSFLFPRQIIRAPVASTNTFSVSIAYDLQTDRWTEKLTAWGRTINLQRVTLTLGDSCVIRICNMRRVSFEGRAFCICYPRTLSPSWSVPSQLQLVNNCLASLQSPSMRTAWWFLLE